MFIIVVIKLEGGTESDITAANAEEIDDESVLDLLTPEQLKKKEEEKKLREAGTETNGAKEAERNASGKL